MVEAVAEPAVDKFLPQNRVIPAAAVVMAAIVSVCPFGISKKSVKQLLPD